ncbi:hypothetical protein C7S20_05655 [Christiangramia fulva]|uniref:Uncharacterized protein n=1 Tax=Christiangramia fulva TaxID=2126553 RepID=A0A2R3Z3F1_9FLAO|nr:hypothetical protein [Christiangramia fulva]AVR44793.1 hypothetical protein C7S20_05655 [Christiangramia fulva]
MTNSLYRIEIVANPTAKGEAIIKTKDIKRDLLMTSRRIALFKFEEYFETFQSGNLLKDLKRKDIFLRATQTFL